MAVRVEHEGGVIARVVHGALPGGAVVLVARGERGGVEGPHRGVRVRDPAASKRFYMTIASHAELRIGVDKPDHVQMVGENFSFSLIDDERPLTEHVHLAFPAQDDATVRAFHAAALAAGYEDHGGPGERAVYHPGYYGAFVLDPDGHNIEVVNHNR